MSRLPGASLKGRRVFITGHTGFTGVWMCHWLLENGAELTGYALSPPDDQPLNLFDASGLSGRMTSHIGDIRDPASLRAVMDEARPEVVFHLAAQPIVKLSYTDPETTYSTNVMGTLHTLQAARSAGAAVLVNITSDKAYENKEWIWGYRENDPMGGHDMYSSSKACADLLARSFWLSFCQGEGAMRLATGRAGNIIGGGDWAANRLVPDIARAYMNGEAVVIRRPSAVRPWQHVLEAVRGYIMLAEALANNRFNGQALNFGPQPSNIAAVGELGALMAGRMDGMDLVINPDSSSDHEANLLRLDITKAAVELDWKPQLDFESTVEMTANFYRNMIAAPGATQRLLEQDIAAYQSTLVLS